MGQQKPTPTAHGTHANLRLRTAIAFAAMLQLMFPLVALLFSDMRSTQWILCRVCAVCACVVCPATHALSMQTVFISNRGGAALINSHKYKQFTCRR